MQCAVVLSTVSVFTGIRAPVIRVPSPSRLASEEQFDGTGYGTVTPRIRPSNDGRIRPYDGREGSLVSLIIHGQRSIKTSPLRPAPSLCHHPHRRCGSESVAGSIIFEFVTSSMHSTNKTHPLLRRHPHRRRLTDCPRPSANAANMRHSRPLCT